MKCKCGCGQKVKSGNIFINHHNARGKFNSNYGSNKFHGKRKSVDWTGKRNPSCIRINLSEEHKEKISKKLSGRNNPMFGKVSLWKRIKYNNIWMKSSWEIKFAKYLDNKQIVWRYEYKTFNLEDSTYTPDFYLPETDEYIEIKGYCTKEFKIKHKKFLILYPDIKFKVLYQKDLKNLEII